MPSKPYPTKCDRWRADHPNALRQWRTAHGTVSQFWGMRVYCGRCRDCATPVTTSRDVSAYNWGQTQIGRWPALCPGCRAKKSDAHSERARYRMAELRRNRAQSRDAQFKAVGLPPVRQGVSQQLTPSIAEVTDRVSSVAGYGDGIDVEFDEDFCSE